MDDAFNKLELFTKIDELRFLKKNWNGYNDDPINREFIKKAQDFVKSLGHDILWIVPKVVPMSQGRLQLEWHHAGCSLEIEFGEQIVHLKCSGESCEEKEVKTQEEIESLIKWFNGEVLNMEKEIFHEDPVYHILNISLTRKGDVIEFTDQKTQLKCCVPVDYWIDGWKKLKLGSILGHGETRFYFYDIDNLTRVDIYVFVLRGEERDSVHTDIQVKKEGRPKDFDRGWQTLDSFTGELKV